MTVPQDVEHTDEVPKGDPSDETQPDKVTTWPYLVRIEMLAAMATMIVLTAWSILVDAPLEAPANPNVTPNPAKAPWYFLGLQEILVYFDPWIAGVMIPSFIIVGLMAIPYLDPNPLGSGYFTFRRRPFAVSAFLFGFLGLWIVPILIGVFCRGPGWNWYWPWESWEVEKTPDLATVDLPAWLGLPAVLAWYGLGAAFYRWKRAQIAAAGFGAGRYAAVAFLVLTMAAIPLKIALRLAFNVKYVLVTPWFNV